MSGQHPARAWADLFDAMTHENYRAIGERAHPQIYFRDPFNEFTGIERLITLFAKMYADTKAARFSTHYVMEGDERSVLSWRFRCEVAVLGALDFDGLSEVHHDSDGLITRHVDYWDAGNEVYAKLPLLGAVLRRFKNRLALR